MSGKGDKRRPCLVPREEYEKNYEAVFGKKKHKPTGKRKRKTSK